LYKKYHSTCRALIKNGIYHPCYNGDVINKAEKFKYDTSKFIKSLENIIRKGCDISTIVDSF